jgi:hypothetical protein
MIAILLAMSSFRIGFDYTLPKNRPHPFAMGTSFLSLVGGLLRDGRWAGRRELSTDQGFHWAKPRSRIDRFMRGLQMGGAPRVKLREPRTPTAALS